MAMGRATGSGGSSRGIAGCQSRGVRRIGDEAGQSLVIVILAMFVIFAVAALAVDVSQWEVNRHQDQVAADSAALAGANCMATPGQTWSTCLSQATQIASDNGRSSASITNNSTAQTVSVTASQASEIFFSAAIGVTPGHTSAIAVAHYTPGSTPSCTTTATNLCASIFAMGQGTTTGCPDGSSTAAISFNGGGDTINGAVTSNGSIYLESGTTVLNGTVTYGPDSPGSTCSADSSHGHNGGSGDGNGAVGKPVQEAQLVPPSAWPDDYYTTTFPPCSTTGGTCTGACAVTTTPCPAADQTPSYCNVASTANITISSSSTSGDVYCAVGTASGAEASDPSKYRGFIDLTDANQSPAITATMLAGVVQCGVKDCSAQAVSGDPLACAADTNAQASTDGGVSYAFTGTAQSELLNGAIFAPMGTIQFNGAGSTENFLEAQQVIFTGGSFSGIGPIPAGSGGGTQGSDTLIQ